ncbi:RING-H2 finger protein ATL43-like [Andrographis paniculata]|uniref:RING-H2 finger protein ATL43-like n=1 Tax=Andrographis paniculata TaxID=175694 RepID=UPI0021E85204|nr:RING-H2 finger protein ATL43-like [Andrographis paniculata]
MELFFSLFLLNHTHTAPSPAPPPPRIGQFRPGIAVIVAVLTTVFSATFLLLMYMKHCRREAYAVPNPNAAGRGYYYTATANRNSGVDRKVIESLPMFRFSSLTGQKKDGLECAVCLNKFAADEVLRLLPKCKHAFHVECVDTWLDAHSTCPLCRCRVDPEDVLLLDCGAAGSAPPRNSGSKRISGRHSSAGERGSAALEMIAEKSNPNPNSNSNPNPGRPDFLGRVSLDSWHSRRKSGNPNPQILENQGRSNSKTGAARKDGQLLGAAAADRLEHRIVISAAEGPRRWSDAQAAEILYLRAGEMIVSGNGNGRSVNKERSVSEITGVSRYTCNNRDGKGKGKGKQEEEERAVVRRWLDWISQSEPAGHSAPGGASIVV